MDEPTDPGLNERLAALEAQVSALREQVERLSRQQHDGASAEAAAPPPLETEAAAPPPLEDTKTKRSRQRPARKPSKKSSKRMPRPQAARVRKALRSEDWISRLGIALLLIGLALLFKLGIDRGWLTPVVRVGFGVVLGLFLLGVGVRLRPKRVALGRVLLGGSIATFYVTIFAAYQFYDLVPYLVAFGAMILVTVLGFVLAVQQHDAVLGIIATIGGLGTPFLLYTEEGSIPGLVLYTCLILAGAGSIYLYRGWRVLLWTAALGGWLVVLVPWFQWVFDDPGAFADRMAVQAGLVFCWLAFSVMPAVREVWHRRNPARWPTPPLKAFKKDDLVGRPALALTIIAPLVTLGLSRELWDLSDVAWGLIGIGAAVLYAMAYWPFRRLELPRLASAHAIAAALVLVIGWSALVDEPWMWYLAMAIEAAALHVLASRLPDRALRFLGHVGAFIVVMVLAGRVVNLDGQIPVLVNGRALVDLAVIALLFGTAWTIRTKGLALAYILAAYVGLLGWFWRDLVALPEGQAYVSIAWGLCALAMLAQGWRSDVDWIRNTGAATLLVVVVKLFLVDLARLEAVWRILLFLGFGGLLLLLSYFFPKLWKPNNDDEEEEAEPEATPGG